MPTRTQVIVPIAAAAVIVGVVGLLSIPSDAKIDAAEFPIGIVKVDGHVLEVQIADNEPRRKRGLMFQEQLRYDQGMLLVFDRPGPHAIWMHNVLFPLDVIWFDSDGDVVHIKTSVKPCQTALEVATCPNYFPTAQATYILEVTSGFVDEFGIGPDSRLEIVSI